MASIAVSLIIAVVILAIALWAIQQIAPPDLRYVLRIIAIAAFLIWLVVRLLPMLSGVV